jgi:hypothetical protein
VRTEYPLLHRKKNQLLLFFYRWTSSYLLLMDPKKDAGWKVVLEYIFPLYLLLPLGLTDETQSTEMSFDTCNVKYASQLTRFASLEAIITSCVINVMCYLASYNAKFPFR